MSQARQDLGRAWLSVGTRPRPPRRAPRRPRCLMPSASQAGSRRAWQRGVCPRSPALARESRRL